MGTCWLDLIFLQKICIFFSCRKIPYLLYTVQRKSHNLQSGKLVYPCLHHRKIRNAHIYSVGKMNSPYLRHKTVE
jgi:hypothetical protein